MSREKTASQQNKISCHDCGCVHGSSKNANENLTNCHRCHANLFEHTNYWLDKTLALTLSAIVFFILSNSLPFLEVELGGSSYETTLLSGVSAMLSREQYFLGLLVLSTIFIFPLLELLSLAYLSVSYLRRVRLPGQTFVLNALTTLRPWSMMEIFLISMIVALVKMSDYFTLTPGPALFSFFALVFCLVGANRYLNKHALWEWLEPNDTFYLNEDARLIPCSHCHAHIDEKLLEQNPHCPRCQQKVYLRTPNSFQKSAALTLAAAILYIPANTFPMLYSTQLGSVSEDTILSGVLQLVESGWWMLALIVFVASFAVPTFKIMVMGFLLYSVKTKSKKNSKQKTQIYRLIEFIGRWSMVDVFVVTLLVAMVQFNFIAGVEAGIAAIAFGAVVILTMLATEAFDQRMLWDEDE